MTRGIIRRTIHGGCAERITRRFTRVGTRRGMTRGLVGTQITDGVMDMAVATRAARGATALRERLA
jgi:hypothetical protein